MADEPMRDRVRTRERILAAAEALLSDQSARNLKVRDIAARAGVSASLVVQYFISKDALVLDVGLRRLATFAAPETDSDAARVVAEMLAADHANASLLREVMRQSWWWAPTAESAFQDALAPRVRALRAAAPGAPPAQVNAALCVYFEGLRRAFAESKALQECAETMTDTVLAILSQGGNSSAL